MLMVKACKPFMPEPLERSPACEVAPFSGGWVPDLELFPDCPSSFEEEHVRGLVLDVLAAQAVHAEESEAQRADQAAHVEPGAQCVGGPEQAQVPPEEAADQDNKPTEGQEREDQGKQTKEDKKGTGGTCASPCAVQ
eukprot:TRINITY_DN6437_c0_g1_i2.p1 TRINITY_DN6437_c0_g1~~TRINITY_DN6437_c0_g1_i2.p1  ORF type:complete len:137 (+),score=41.09 TRINITY_DN6437_c0_g1_i2:260-670(+)